MRVWVILSIEVEYNYLKARSKSPYPTSMPVGEEVEATLASHNISLPISKRTAQNWMSKSKATRCGTQKTYYNDQNQKVDVLKHLDEKPATLTKLQRRMRVWVILSKEKITI